eukprot:TRINITY_DN4573_c0_g1_i1.p1 TRINITY_DN4573_c0_g1~~TRINITY_DN4573_c0_g1_i1.p1  ORF type:complete len:245 (+),score=38.64 TRINITY_DN4573_c0_g1_i1:84-818(+)
MFSLRFASRHSKRITANKSKSFKGKRNYLSLKKNPKNLHNSLTLSRGYATTTNVDDKSSSIYLYRLSDTNKSMSYAKYGYKLLGIGLWGECIAAMETDYMLVTLPLAVLGAVFFFEVFERNVQNILLKKTQNGPIMELQSSNSIFFNTPRYISLEKDPIEVHPLSEQKVEISFTEPTLAQRLASYHPLLLRIFGDSVVTYTPEKEVSTKLQYILKKKQLDENDWENLKKEDQTVDWEEKLNSLE